MWRLTSGRDAGALDHVLRKGAVLCSLTLGLCVYFTIRLHVPKRRPKLPSNTSETERLGDGASLYYVLCMLERERDASTCAG